MKPAPFTLHVPNTIEEATRVLSMVAGEDGRVLAGGQTLCPAMALRLARPSHLVDINRIGKLARVAIAGETLEIGAIVRHAAFHRPVAPGPLGSLLAAVARHIAHLPIRNRGTFCGSLANADAASEWCLVAATLDTTLVAVSVRGERRIDARTFFKGFMSTALAQDEILREARIPLLPADTRFGFKEFSRRAGDFAQAAALAVYGARDGIIQNARVGVGAVEPAPRRIAEAEAMLEAKAPSRRCFEKAADAAAEAVSPAEDTGDGRQYKRDLVRAAVLRALLDTL